MRACLATILGLSVAEVPNFNEATKQRGLAGQEAYLAMHEMIRDFLRPRGLSIFNSYCNGDWPIEKALDYFSGHSPGVPIIFHGMANLVPDEMHAVVALDGKIAHDPSGAGIAKAVEVDGQRWWFMDVISVSVGWDAERERGQ